MMRNVDAIALAAISNRCTEMMQVAAVAYYSRKPDDRAHYSERVVEQFRELADRLGFEIVEKEMAQ
jgi:DhnA family fructose-bisphosphate aldolase class Ia